MITIDELERRAFEFYTALPARLEGIEGRLPRARAYRTMLADAGLTGGPGRPADGVERTLQGRTNRSDTAALPRPGRR